MPTLSCYPFARTWNEILGRSYCCSANFAPEQKQNYWHFVDHIFVQVDCEELSLVMKA